MRYLILYITAACIVLAITTGAFPLNELSKVAVEDLSDYWFFRLLLNILGYSTILLPGALIIYMVRKTKYLDRKERNCIQRSLYLCIYGAPEERTNLEHGDVKDVSQNYERSTYHEAFILLMCFFGLQVSYLTWGVLQEKIMTQKYENLLGQTQKFNDSQFLVFVNRVLAFLFSGVYLLFTRQPRHSGPLYKYSYCSFSNVMSSWCQYEALKYVSFPTQVLAKASKVIPVMLMGKLVSKKTYSLHEYATAILISLGMVLFLLSRGEERDKGTVTTFSGIIVLAGYMIFDSFTSNWQGELFTQYHMSSVQMMCGVNLFSCILTSVSLVQQGAFSSSIVFMYHFSQFFLDCILLSVCSATGQLFIFYTISQFGPVVFVIIMTIRQAIAILLSCLIYRHALKPEGIVGILIVFGAIFFRIYYNQKMKSAKRIQKAGKGLGNGQPV